MSALTLTRLLAIALACVSFSQRLSAQTPVMFDPARATALPGSASIIRHSPNAVVTIQQNRLFLTPFSKGNSAFTGLVMKPQAPTAQGFEVSIDIEAFEGTGIDKHAYPALWVGAFPPDAPDREGFFLYEGSWLGLAVQLEKRLPVVEGEAPRYWLAIWERWSESGEGYQHAEQDKTASFRQVALLSGLPTHLKVRIRSTMVRVELAGATIEPKQGNLTLLTNKSFEYDLNSNLAQVMAGPLRPAFGLSNYGDQATVPEVRLRGFSINPSPQR
jgi:hypothetical protein